MAQLNYDRASTILVEAVFFGDVPTAKRWGIHHRTIENYRQRLDSDNQLVLLFQSKKESFESEWAKDIPMALRSAIRFLQDASQSVTVTPESIHAVAGAAKILAEIGLTKEIIDARLGRHDRPDRETGEQMEYPLLQSSTDN